MGFVKWLVGKDEWDNGYDAANEFMEIVGDQELSDDEINAHWQAVESGHNEEYVQGYADYFKPWWKLW